MRFPPVLNAARSALRIGLIGLLVTACGSSAERARPPEVRAGEFGKPDCFLRWLAADFEVLDDRNLIVFAPGRSDAYHVQVSPPAPELRFAQALAFESRNSQVCGYAGDDLLVTDAGRSGSRLSVIGVFRLDTVALAGLEARFGKGHVREKPRPEPGSGAEVERNLSTE